MKDTSSLWTPTGITTGSLVNQASRPMCIPIQLTFHIELAKKKALDLLNPPAPTTSLSFSEFGTRRRRSFKAQDIIMRGLIAGHEEYKSKGGSQGILSGTSNVSIGCRFVAPI